MPADGLQSRGVDNEIISCGNLFYCSTLFTPEHYRMIQSIVHYRASLGDTITGPQDSSTAGRAQGWEVRAVHIQHTLVQYCRYCYVPKKVREDRAEGRYS